MSFLCRFPVVSVVESELSMAGWMRFSPGSVGSVAEDFRQSRPTPCRAATLVPSSPSRLRNIHAGGGWPIQSEVGPVRHAADVLWLWPLAAHQGLLDQLIDALIEVLNESIRVLDLIARNLDPKIRQVTFCGFGKPCNLQLPGLFTD